MSCLAMTCCLIQKQQGQPIADQILYNHEAQRVASLCQLISQVLVVVTER
jgi:hypothetical protein